eukprot:scaffold47063_cov19-Tisochrysis_lutea.AAC.4
MGPNLVQSQSQALASKLHFQTFASHCFPILRLYFMRKPTCAHGAHNSHMYVHFLRTVWAFYRVCSPGHTYMHTFCALLVQVMGILQPQACSHAHFERTHCSGPCCQK